MALSSLEARLNVHAGGRKKADIRRRHVGLYLLIGQSQQWSFSCAAKVRTTEVNDPTTLTSTTDESLHMMSGMLAALTPSSGGTTQNPELVEHCERLVVRLQDPYLRAMLTYLAVREWSEVLQEEALPLCERLAIAFQFLDDRDLGSYLHRVASRSSHDGNLEGLIVTGLTTAALDILQTYVDVTGDVQTAATLSSMTPAGAHDSRAERWLEAYRDLLDGWKLFHHRCQFDTDRGRVLQDAVQNEELVTYEWAPRQILLRCNYCNKSMDPTPLEVRSHAPRVGRRYGCYGMTPGFDHLVLAGHGLPSLWSPATTLFCMPDGAEYCARCREERSVDPRRFRGCVHRITTQYARH